MTEAEWLAGPEPLDMLTHVGERGSDRKLRLFALAVFCRSTQLGGSNWDRVVRLAERYADHTASEKEIAPLMLSLFDGSLQTRATRHVLSFGYPAAVGAIREIGKRGQDGQELVHTDPVEVAAQVAYFRDIFGNPFRPVAFDARWRTADVLGLARGIYEDRAFDRMPLLADALMDAGCDSDDLLTHCRGDGPHVRGCWVVDLVLGKE